MTTRPATPLPWNSLPYKAGDRELDAIRTDDAYELHAANSYPRLVEALKLARIELIREGHDPLSACISKDIDPLLRSLGESERGNE